MLRPRTDRSTVPPQQLRQLGDVGGDPARLVTGQQVGGGAAARLVLEVDIGQRAWPLLSLTMKQAALASSMSHGGGKRRAEGMDFSAYLFRRDS
jgi:hypothetical protein